VPRLLSRLLRSSPPSPFSLFQSLSISLFLSAFLRGDRSLLLPSPSSFSASLLRGSFLSVARVRAGHSLFVSRPFLLLRFARVPLERRDDRRKVIILRMRAEKRAQRSFRQPCRESAEERHDRDLASSVTRSKFAIEREREHLSLSLSLFADKWPIANSEILTCPT